MARKFKIWDFHLDRSFQGLKFLHSIYQQGFTREFISEEIKKLCVENARVSKSTGAPEYFQGGWFDSNARKKQTGFYY